jgi:FG-GAP-like repeat/Bacterial Ig-like domain (group 3)
MKPLRLASLFRVLAFVVGMNALAAGQKLQVKFGAPTIYETGANDVVSVAVADLNGDGNLDIVVANECNNNFCENGTVSVLLGNGDGTFQPAATYSTGAVLAESVEVGDLNGDGIPDLVVTNQCLSFDQFGVCNSDGVVSVLLGVGNGTFQSPVTYSTGAYGATSVAIADLRGEGILDLVVADNCQEGCLAGTVSVLLGNGDGTFQPAVTYSSGGQYADSVAVADVDGNGVPDLVVANQCQNEGGCAVDGAIGVLLGNGDGTFQPAAIYDSGSNCANTVAVADLRGDGIMDLAVANGYYNNVVGVLLGNGDGTFQPAATYALKGELYDYVAIGDVNGDGIPDLAVTDGCQKVTHGACVGNATVSILLGNGNGTFQSPIKYDSGGSGVGEIAIGDLNGDGRPDLVVNICQDSNCNNGLVAVLLNETSYTTKTALTSSPNPAQVNQTVMFTATITSTPSVPNGEVVTFYDGKTELGTGATADGVATLSTSFAKAKSYTIKASYPGDAFRKASSGTVKQVVN